MTALRGEKAYFTRCKISASEDRWEMNAAHLVQRLNKSFFCPYAQAHFLLDFLSADVQLSVCFFFVCVCASMKAPAPPWHCLLITQICAQSEEIMNESFNYASRQRIPDASTTPLAR